MKTVAAHVVALVLFLGAGPVEADVTLVMFRHGEKPELGLGQLNCQGLNRALALPDVLLTKFGKPDALVAPNPGVMSKDKGQPYNYIRPLATIEPTAIRLGMPVETHWGLTAIDSLEQELLGPQHDGQLIYVAWEHNLLAKAARAIVVHRGGDPALVPDWASADFDSIYVIRVPKDGPVTFRIEHEGLDGQSTSCPSAR